MSLALVALAVLLFVRSVRARDHEHGDRLALLPVEGDEAQAVHAPARALRASAIFSAHSPADGLGTPVAMRAHEEDPQ